MVTKRRIDIYSAGCAVCQETVKLVEKIVCQSCEVTVLDMQDDDVAVRAKALGIRAVPAIVIDGELLECCSGCGPDERSLRAAGIGNPIT